MVFERLRRRSQRRDVAHRLYESVVAQARRVPFYRDFGVPDTLDGRFELILLHAALVLRRLRGDGPDGAALGQTMFEVMIDDMDRSLREMGVGDLSVGRRVKQMVRAFYGRAAAYETALAGDEAALAAALRRNLYGTVEPEAADVAALAGYVRRQARSLDGPAGDALIAGEAAFDAPPAKSERED